MFLQRTRIDARTPTEYIYIYIFFLFLYFDHNMKALNYPLRQLFSSGGAAEIFYRLKKPHLVPWGLDHVKNVP